jgi:hypothetical protein
VRGHQELNIRLKVSGSLRTPSIVEIDLYSRPAGPDFATSVSINPKAGPNFTSQQEEDSLMTYYRVDFTGASDEAPRAKKFRTKESAKKHARRVLGPLDDSALASRVSIVAVSRDGMPVDEL